MKPGDWEPDTSRLEEIRAQLQWEQLYSLSIVKTRPDGRIGLQDEVYRIYAERMGEQKQNRTDERDARQLMYRKLLLWAEYRQASLEVERRGYQEDDERGRTDLLTCACTVCNVSIGIGPAVSRTQPGAYEDPGA